ncbi:uncharacterized protein BcabD6B2_18710 [Babesia caballi]|uniref:Uncharacterized protein n=1 Tax=Babesia caballi TaxID=5871 RepID=A0AAV4LRJ0_BABCB|nr:hypothetical protein, conserved [Babesia caballi]
MTSLARLCRRFWPGAAAKNPLRPMLQSCPSGWASVATRGISHQQGITRASRDHGLNGAREVRPWPSGADAGTTDQVDAARGQVVERKYTFEDDATPEKLLELTATYWRRLRYAKPLLLTCSVDKAVECRMADAVLAAGATCDSVPDVAALAERVALQRYTSGIVGCYINVDAAGSALEGSKELYESLDKGCNAIMVDIGNSGDLQAEDYVRIDDMLSVVKPDVIRFDGGTRLFCAAVAPENAEACRGGDDSDVAKLSSCNFISERHNAVVIDNGWRAGLLVLQPAGVHPVVMNASDQEGTVFSRAPSILKKLHGRLTGAIIASMLAVSSSNAMLAVITSIIGIDYSASKCADISEGPGSLVLQLEGVGVREDELLARLHVAAHQQLQHLRSPHAVLHRNPPQHALVGVHGGVPQLLRHHLAQTLEALHRQTLGVAQPVNGPLADLASGFVNRCGGGIGDTAHVATQRLGQLGVAPRVGVGRPVRAVALARGGTTQVGDAVERGAGDVDAPVLVQLRADAEEQPKQQDAQVGAVDVGVGEEDDLAVPERESGQRGDDLAAVRSLAQHDLLRASGHHRLHVGQRVLPPRARVHGEAQRGDEQLDLLVLHHLQIARQHGLEAAVARLLRVAGGALALDDEDLGGVHVVGGAVGELGGEPGGEEVGVLLLDELLGVLGGLEGLPGGQRLVVDGQQQLRVLLQDLSHLVGHNALHRGARHLVAQLRLGLPVELGGHQLHRDDGRQALADEVAAQRRGLGLEVARPAAAVVDCLGDGRFESVDVGAGDRAHVVGEAAEVRGAGVGRPAEGGFHLDAVGLAADVDDVGRFVQRGAVLDHVLQKLPRASSVHEGLLPHGAVLVGPALVHQAQRQQRVDVGELLHAGAHRVVLEGLAAATARPVGHVVVVDLEDSVVVGEEGYAGSGAFGAFRD